ncbi:polyprenol monophosphomannose synthase [Bradymonas sediminis]|uniref:Polyprenol monophosphomannose synthase n=1 Tax=Bradymonas sediminis TaxID=1548548 RepID=A0A2Z4FGA8_9DELT|nr:polyprenol monophosphomannose synthase [Bradymonas sediminis]AWV87967.1 polyprenol monophosphomannose synthase [Bradymonas sediminis]TDP62986.1 dolichol-phosphate mannosyltransferase [Bradymonas sediminis]
MPRTLICMPTYNEAENIRPIIAAIAKVVPEVHVLVIDDNSPDGTGDIADELAAADPRIHVLHRKEKAGLGKAYIAGFEWGLDAGYDYIIEMDADFSHQPKYLPEMIAQLEKYDVVVGSRYVAGGGTEDWGVVRKVISRGGGIYARTILGIDVQDLTAGFVAWRAGVLRDIDIERVEASGYVFQIEMKYRAYKRGYRLLEIPIVFPDRTVGVSKMSPNIAAEALWRVWGIRFKK